MFYPSGGFYRRLAPPREIRGKSERSSMDSELVCTACRMVCSKFVISTAISIKTVATSDY